MAKNKKNRKNVNSPSKLYKTDFPTKITISFRKVSVNSPYIRLKIPSGALKPFLGFLKCDSKNYDENDSKAVLILSPISGAIMPCSVSYLTNGSSGLPLIDPFAPKIPISKVSGCDYRIEEILHPGQLQPGHDESRIKSNKSSINSPALIAISTNLPVLDRPIQNKVDKSIYNLASVEPADPSSSLSQQFNYATIPTYRSSSSITVATRPLNAACSFNSSNAVAYPLKTSCSHSPTVTVVARPLNAAYSYPTSVTVMARPFFFKKKFNN